MNTSGQKLAGRSAIVTGGAQGIGARFAETLASNGASVCVCDLLPTTDVVERINANGGRAIGLTADVTNSSDVANVAAEVERVFGRIDVLVNNAALFGTLQFQSFWDISSDDWDRVMTVNTRGTFECSKAVVPAMRRAGYGKIINIASGTVYRGVPMLMHYVASKGAVVAMTRVMARELGDFGIAVNAIAPGLTMSPNAQAMYGAPMREAIIASRCFKRDETPDDIVGAAVFLSSADSDFITGQVMVVDGGTSMP